jgi:Hypoxia induced protein conserved region
MIGKILIVLSMVVVVGILFAGIAVMAIGGEANAKWSNVLMRYRVIAQTIAVGILLLVLYFSQR